MFTELLLRKGFYNTAVQFLRACTLRALPNNGRCLESHCLAAGLYAIVLTIGRSSQKNLERHIPEA
jgi:hypothetical protein